MLRSSGFWLLATGYWLLASGFFESASSQQPVAVIRESVSPKEQYHPKKGGK